MKKNKPQNVSTELSVPQQQSLAALYQKGKFKAVISQAKRLLDQYPNSIFLLNTLAGAHARLSQFEPAIASLRKILEIRPDLPEIYLNMGTIMKDHGDLKGAIDSYNQALKIKPDFVEANYHIGDALEKQGNLEAAMGYYQQTLRLKPDYAKAHFNIGNVLSKQRKLEDAITKYRQALKIRPDLVNAYFNMGNAQWEQGDTEAAIESLEQGLKIQPDHARSYASLLEILEKSNMTEDFSSVLVKAKKHIHILPDDLKFYEATELWRKKHYQESLGVLETLTLSELPENIQSIALNLKGKCCDKLKKFDQAFVCFEQMNKLQKSSELFQQCNPDKYFETYINQLEQIRESNYQVPENSEKPVNDQPVFLVGFPRSGTTLLDTMLRSHSKINVVEEKLMIEYVKHSLQTGVDLKKIEGLNDENTVVARNAYFEELDKHTTGSKNDRLVIDKLPLNILEVPLIHKLFPDARIVLAVRHPLDSILSCWMQNFKLNDAMANMLDLERAVDLYCLAMDTLKASIDRYDLCVHTIKYENIVQDMKTALSALLDFLGLEWEAGLEDYRHTALQRNRINTPSYSQVVQPLYKDASYRWKNYRQYLQPYFEKIRPWVNEFGYEPCE